VSVPDPAVTDWVPIGGGQPAPPPGSMVLIERKSLVGQAAQGLNWQNIPQTFSHLLLLGRVRGGQVIAVSGLSLRFNADFGNNYYYENLVGGGGTPTAGAGGPAGFLSLASIPAASGGVDDTSAIRVDIPFYADTNARKVASSVCGMWTNTLVMTGLWANTAAITSIQLWDPSGNLTDPTIVDLYGIV
jgi:hypothetical protein